MKTRFFMVKNEELSFFFSTTNELRNRLFDCGLKAQLFPLNTSGAVRVYKIEYDVHWSKLEKWEKVESLFDYLFMWFEM